MQIVIEISDEYYAELKYRSEFLRKMYNTARYNRAEIAILDGTPLPKNHGVRKARIRNEVSNI